ncbi:uncharacterized protein LOC123504821 [Portunus trituberculatus]|uniref:uncharacterized protein LOC123504821 n=1 Tax=Portunus trituberculatus TaxID=210409 RepID=UPI001E1D1019|nr:uncharacterized protein LOC123504821 [Portunus trituberculatus]
MEMAKRGLLFLHRACSASLTRQDRLDILFGTFFVHLILTMLSNLCGCLTQSFLLYNGLFLGTVIWSLHHRESEEPAFLAMCTDCFAFVFDIVNLSIFWPTILTGSIQFGLVMAMLNLALRPMSAFLLYRVVQDRATDHGGSSTLPSSLQGIFNPTPYEDIDQEGAQAVIPKTQTPRHSKDSKDPIVA